MTPPEKPRRVCRPQAADCKPFAKKGFALFGKQNPALPSGRAGILYLILLFLAAVGSLHALFVVENGLAHAQALGGDLQQLVVGQELQALLQAQLPGRHQAQGLVGPGGPHIGHLLLLADVDGDVLAGRGVAHDLACVDLLAGVDDQGAALLGVEQAVGDGVAGLKADQGAGGAGLNVTVNEWPDRAEDWFREIGVIE